MPDSSPIPLRSAQISAAEEQNQPKLKGSSEEVTISPAGPRKLVRPRLPAAPANARYVTPAGSAYPTPVKPRATSAMNTQADDNHNEAFYLQKQIQSHTLMVFVLEQGDQVEGYIEWFDRDAIKVRNGTLRTLIYKASLKYLFKAGEPNPRQAF